VPERELQQTRPELDTVRTRLPYWTNYGPVIDVTFPVANVKRDIAHRLGHKPSGYHLVFADGPVYAEPGAIWTRDLAYLRATNANTHARIVFLTLQGDPREP
jgi:hypothetical protein